MTEILEQSNIKLKDNANYPKQYANLLVKAKLLGKGRMILRCKNMTLDTMRYEDDTPTAPERKTLPSSPGILYLSFVKGTDNYYIGDWRKGLDEKEIEIINRQCNVPIPSEWYDDIRLVEGQEFDLSIPYHMFLYRGAQNSPQLAHDRLAVNDNQIFWFEDINASEMQADEKTKAYQSAIELITKLNDIEKAQLMKIMHYEFGVLEAGNSSSKVNVESNIIQFMSDDYRRGLMKKAWEKPEKKQLLLMYEALENQVINVTDAGTIVYNSNRSEIAVSKSDFCDKVSKNKDLAETIIKMTEIAKSAPTIVNSGEVSPNNLLGVEDYSLEYSTYEDLKYWPIEAVRMLLDREKVSYSENEGKDDLIRIFRKSKEREAVKPNAPAAQTK